MKRYFIVFFTATETETLGNGRVANGEFTYQTDGSFLSFRWVKNDIRTVVEKQHNFTLKHINITNIMELSKEDYDDWCSEIHDWNKERNTNSDEEE